MIFIFILSFILLGCHDQPTPGSMADDTAQTLDSSSENASSAEDSKTPQSPLFDEDVMLDIDVVVTPDSRVEINGNTNLPADTILSLSIKEQAEGGFYGQSRTSVAADGTFTSETFGPPAGFEGGLYLANVVMPVTRIQPDSVRETIGDHGGNLTGALVDKNTLGVTVSTEKVFTVGGEQAVTTQLERVQQRLKEYREWQQKIEKLHSRVENAPSPRELAKWGAFSRGFTEDYKAYQNELSDMRPAYRRGVLGDPLNTVYRMFKAKTRSRPQEYNEASRDYVTSLQELQGHIDATESNL